MPKKITVRPTSLQEAREMQDEAENMSVITARAITVFNKYTIVKFHGRPLILTTTRGFEHYKLLSKDRFEELFYGIVGGVSRSATSDVFNYVINIAPDVSDYDHYYLLGDWIWDAKELRFVDDVDISMVVWRSPVLPVEPSEPVKFLLDAAKGDMGVYEDMLQSMAPILMDKKPYGVFWWVGDGANGKSSLMEALYRLFPYQLCSLTVRGLTDGRDTPMLNGYLANVVKESSEGRVEDTQIYKSIGTHEDFQVHKFHSQDAMTIRGNMHHIFSANQIPSFNDKGFSARRRTFIIPFNNRFEGDPTFEERTFTPEVLGQLLSEMLRVSVEIKERQYRYKFSKITENAKMEYDGEANNAEDYARSLLDDGIVAFDSFQSVKIDYENWCADQGFTPLGVNNMRRAIQSIGFERRSVKLGGFVDKRYVVKTVEMKDMREIGISRRGFFTAPGFMNTKKSEEVVVEAQESLGEW